MARRLRIGNTHGWASTPIVAFNPGVPATVNLATFAYNPHNKALTYSVTSGALPAGATLSGSVVTWDGRTDAWGASPCRFGLTYGGQTQASPQLNVVVNTPPAVPAYVNATEDLTDEVEVTWQPGIGGPAPTVYRVFDAATSDGTYAQVSPDITAPTTAWTRAVTPGSPGRYYKVRAVSGALLSSLSTPPALGQPFTPPVTGFPLFQVYSAIVADRGGTPIPLSNTRYWSARPTIPAGGTTHATVAALNGIASGTEQNPGIHKLAPGPYPGANITINANDVIVSLSGCDFTQSGRVRINGARVTLLAGRWANSSATSGNIPIRAYGNDAVVALCVFDGYNGPGGTTQLPLVDVDSLRVRVCYNSFDNHNTRGRYVHVQGDPGIPTYCRVDHNRFLNQRAPADAELVQFGQQQHGTNYFGLLDNNYAYRHNNDGTGATVASGEVEICTLKASRIFVIQNVFVECNGNLVLRHTSHCDVYGNYFFGGVADEVGGCRLNGASNRVLCNYFQDLNDINSNARGALNFGRGDNQTTGYFATDTNEASFNTIANCKSPIVFGQTGGGTIEPQNNRLYNNAVDKAGASDAITVGPEPDTGTVWGGNVIEPTVGRTSGGITADVPDLVLTNGVYVPITTGANQNCNGAGVSGFSALASVDILGNPIPSNGADVGCFQAPPSSNPWQAIIDEAGP